jgi:hypothetical protein
MSAFSEIFVALLEVVRVHGEWKSSVGDNWDDPLDVVMGNAKSVIQRIQIGDLTQDELLSMPPRVRKSVIDAIMGAQ